MTCYICTSPATGGVRVHDNVTFSYCDQHRGEVAIGVSEYALKGTLDKLEKMKDDYMFRFRGAAYNEFEKCKLIEKRMEDDDSSFTEQGI